LIISHDTYGRDDAELAESELAYGYPSGLKQVGNKIVALFERVSPRFKEWWQNGQLLSVSPSLYRPESPNNPYPGKWSLRHIAALGKSPPAQKDLGQPIGLREFAKGGFGIPQDWVLNLGEFDLPEETDTVDLMGGSVLPMVLRNLREYFLIEKGAEIADKLIPEYAISEAAMAYEYEPEDELMAKPEDDFGCGKKKKGYPMMAEGGQSEPVLMAGETMTDQSKPAEVPANFEEIEKQLAALEAQNKALESRLAAEAHKARVVEITNFCEQHRNRLTINPTATDAVDLGEESTSLVDFMAGLDDKGLSFMQGFIQTLPAQVPTGEVATDFSEPAPAANFSEAIAEARAKLQSMYDANRNGGGI